MLLHRLSTCLALLALAGGDTLHLYEETVLDGGWTVYPISSVIVENATIALRCERNDVYVPIYGMKGFHETNFAVAIDKFEDDPQVEVEMATDILKIGKFGRKYEGEWNCFTMGRDDQGRQVSLRGPTRLLELAVAPTITKFVIPNANESGSVTIECASVDAKPVPTYMLIKQKETGKTLKRVTGKRLISYTISNVAKTDAGLYECVGSNKAGVGSKTEQFTVQYTPVTTIREDEVNTIDETDNIVFNCNSEGVPDPQMRWLKNGREVKSDDISDSILTITNAKKSDTGTYTCEGRNIVGVHYATVMLEVRVPPDAPTDLIAKNKTNVSINLSWTPGFDNFSPIHGYKVTYRVSGSNHWKTARNFSGGTAEEQLVSGLEPLTSYEFRVRARNYIGKGKHSEIGTLTTHPNAPSVGPTNLVETDTQDQTVELSWTLADGSLLPDNEGNISHYEIAYNVYGRNETKSQFTKGVVSSWKLIGLSKGTTFVVKVYARNSGPYRSAPSNEQTLTTNMTVPGKVFNIEVSAITESSLIVSWEAPTDMGGVDTVWYKVEYRTGLEIFKVFAKNLTATMAFISNLKPNSLYTIQVTAVNVVGIGISDDVMDSTVAAAPDVPEFTRQNIGPATEFTISLYLETNNFDVTHFVVAYVRVGDIYEPRWKLRNAEEIANWEKKTVKISELERGKVVIDELQGSSVYALALKVETSDMSSDWSPVIQAETQELQALEVTIVNNFPTPGASVILECNSQFGDPVRDPIWWKENDKILRKDDHYSFSDNKLFIRNINDEDEGVYTCAIRGFSRIYGTSTNLILAGSLQESSNDSGPAVGGGIAVGVIVAVCIIFVVIGYCRSRMKKREKLEVEEDSTQTSFYKHRDLAVGVTTRSSYSAAAKVEELTKSQPQQGKQTYPVAEDPVCQTGKPLQTEKTTSPSSAVSPAAPKSSIETII
ncbi:cell adhesion molecule DSCAM-like isoform X2 [Corticium candelabrum]|uniref:cell adhesion molecule DSCAM-like isoform X2 n=1 Tax=Corticium candelabrum TaxID=121492 RepID=UPI002E259B32|nr:cell adhesion molecule DSCAM-like isoform X2 [Corticium candelabrum]